jgi:hypothetical protein
MSPRTRVILLGLGVLLAACGDSRMGKLSTGISKDSTLKIMGSVPERTEAYLVNGRDIVALFFGKAGADSGTTPSAEMLPVVLINDTLSAWGWESWEKIATENKIPVKR